MRLSTLSACCSGLDQHLVCNQAPWWSASLMLCHRRSGAPSFAFFGWDTTALPLRPFPGHILLSHACVKKREGWGTRYICDLCGALVKNKVRNHSSDFVRISFARYRAASAAARMLHIGNRPAVRSHGRTDAHRHGDLHFIHPHRTIIHGGSNPSPHPGPLVPGCNPAVQSRTLLRHSVRPSHNSAPPC